MIGVELKTKSAKDILNKAMESGLLVLTAKEKVRLLPPLNISYKEIEKGLAILANIL
jgi:acetylornithine/N-succinyldiaminopimelate aminotransferase